MSKSSNSNNTIVGIAIGLVLMFGGMWISKNVHLAFVESLDKQGIPLDPGKIVAVIGVFLILFPVVRFFFIAPLSEAISARTSELERTFSEAETLRTDMDAMRSEYEQRLTATEAQAREQIQAQIREAQNLRATLMAEASAKADEMVEKARQEIEQEKHKVLSEVRLHVTNLTLGATERILGKNVDSETNRKLVQEFIEQVEVPG